MKLLADLKAWLKIPGNSEARLAVLIGYRDAAPIKQWIRRRRIPVFRIEQVTKIVTKGKQNVVTE